MASDTILAPRDDERRNHQRMPLETSVTWNSETNFYTGFTNDISEGGIFVSTYAVAARGAKMVLEFTLPDNKEKICVQAEVRWLREYNPDSDANPGMGLEFVNLSDEDRQRIDAFIKNRETLFYDD